MVLAIGTVCGLIPSTFGRKKRFWRFERAGKICMQAEHPIFACKKLAGFWILFQHEPVGDFGKLEDGET